MERFSVNQLAKLAGVSVRTLHHYDAIGLLKPGIRTESNYRYYGEKELLRLQQILFYKELDIPLAKIMEILDDPAFDTETALRAHKAELLKRKERMSELLKTIDKTIHHLKKQKMKPEDMYQGFSKEQSEAYEKEARQAWGDALVDESANRVKQMDQEGIAKVMTEHEEISATLATLMHLAPEHEKIQALVKRHYAFIHAFYTPTIEVYRGLADLYVNDPRFKQNYEKHKEGLAEFLRKGMIVFCDRLDNGQ